MTFWFCIGFTLWLSHFISHYLKVHFMLIKYKCDSKSQTLRVCYPFQSTGRPISCRNGWSFRIYMILPWDFVPEWNSRPGTRTGVNSRWGDSCLHDILWWYHVNKYRAMRGNRSELAPGRKSPRCHVNTSFRRGSLTRNESQGRCTDTSTLWKVIYCKQFLSYNMSSSILILKFFVCSKKRI